ncbi:MAG: stage 0 sporulation family protein [SAR202 cluster bacterium]|nr:stage 0 sporulation family protein [SAR202 cluster bacterium]
MMEQVVGIRFRKSEPLAYVNAGDAQLHLHDYVVVQTDQGQELGQVAREPQSLVSVQPEQVLPLLVRKAARSDLQRREELLESEERALRLARNKAGQLSLKMKIVDAHYTLDAARVTITFGAEGRVDFRPLLQELGAALRCRVNLRQVGEREVARLAGGVGRCGRTLCCTTWMTKFDAVGVRMAKEQELPISAEGLAGGCGRLRCCLRFEYEQYRRVNQSLPRIGEEVDTPQGPGKVIVGHRLKETVSVHYSNDTVLDWPLAEISRYSASNS